MKTDMLTVLKYIIVMLAGFLLKKLGIVNPSETKILSSIMMYVTLPCAMAACTQGLEPDASLLALALIGLAVGAVMLLVGRFATRDKEEQILFMVNLSSLNIGGYTLPFLQGMLPPAALAFAGMYDIGNTCYGNGISYWVPKAVRDGEGRFEFRQLFKKLCRSVTLIVYLTFLLLALLDIRLPDRLFDFLREIGHCNFLIVFLIAGIVMDLKIDRNGLKTVAKFLLLKYGVGTVLSLAVFFLLPFDLIVRQAIIFCILTPQASTSVAYCQMLKCDAKVYSTIYTCGLLASMAAFFVLGMIWHL